MVSKEDLDMPNHLSGLLRTYLVLYFRSTHDLNAVRRVLLPLAQRNGQDYREGLMPFE